MQIAIAGLGYVGLSLACLLSRQNDVIAIDIDQQRVDAVNAGQSPIKDPLIIEYLAKKPAGLCASTNAHLAYSRANIVIIATPTDYDEITHSFDTSSIENVLNLVETSKSKPTIVIKSTIPVGYTKKVSQLYPQFSILFSPEFLREGHALDDNLHPSRIVVGVTQNQDRPVAEKFANLLLNATADCDTPIRIIGSTEAEAIKLFANTYLALRVSFFNELDTYAESKGINAAEIIDGVCLDGRIGFQYNNPSFGYGGYCLPKDSKQLLSNYEDVPQDLIRAIVDSNTTRKRFIADRIIERHPNTVGVYRLAMKKGSDNFRQSSVIDIINILIENNLKVSIYEPTISAKFAYGCAINNHLSSFFDECDLIIANRWDDDLTPVREKVYTRDLWKQD